MNYEIITDRFEIEKMAEDSFLSDDKTIIHVDYADLRALKRWGTFKHAIICDFNVAANSDWTEEGTYMEDADTIYCDGWMYTRAAE